MYYTKSHAILHGSVCLLVWMQQTAPYLKPIQNWNVGKVPWEERGQKMFASSPFFQRSPYFVPFCLAKCCWKFPVEVKLEQGAVFQHKEASHSTKITEFVHLSLLLPAQESIPTCYGLNCDLLKDIEVLTQNICEYDLVWK